MSEAAKSMTIRSLRNTLKTADGIIGEQKQRIGELEASAKIKNEYIEAAAKRVAELQALYESRGKLKELLEAKQRIKELEAELENKKKVFSEAIRRQSDDNTSQAIHIANQDARIAELESYCDASAMRSNARIKELEAFLEKFSWPKGDAITWISKMIAEAEALRNKDK